VLAGVPSLTDDAGSANERLVRHYVQVGVPTAPEREGRQALFGPRQVGDSGGWLAADPINCVSR